MNRVRARGFTLVEIMIVIALMVIAASAVAVYGQRAERQQRAVKFFNELAMLDARIRDGWASENDYSQVTTTAVIARGFATPTMMVDANNLRNAFGGNWTILPNTWAGGVAEAVVGVSYTLSATNIPTDACIDLLARYSRGFLRIQVNNGAWTSPVSNVGEQPTVATAAASCTTTPAGSPVRMMWTTS